MTTPIISNGSTLAVSTVLPASYDASGFAALTFTQIRGVRTVGDIGKQWRTAERNVAGAQRVDTVRAGGYASGSLQLELVRITDAGQDALRAAIDATVSYSYRLTQPDGKTLYFSAAAISRQHGGFTAGSIADTKMTLSLDSDIVEI